MRQPLTIKGPGCPEQPQGQATGTRARGTRTGGTLGLQLDLIAVKAQLPQAARE